MSLKKIILKSTTMMSLNDRFTYLRSAEHNVRNIRENNAVQHQASVKNRRLAQQMERRPAVMAALKLKKRSLRQRLGQPMVSSVKDRLSLPLVTRGSGRSRGRMRGRGRGRIGLRGIGPHGRGRSLSVSPLNRTNSSDTLRFRRGQNNVFRSPLRRPFRRGRGMATRGMHGMRGIRGSRFSLRGMLRSRGGSFRRGMRGDRGRGNMRRGRGRRGMRGRQSQQTLPSKEELDLQLDQYMANTKSHLDRELDSYMNQAPSETWD